MEQRRVEQPVPVPEQVKSTESSREQSRDVVIEQPTRVESQEKIVSQLPTTTPAVTSATPVQEKDPVLKQVESVLSEDLADIYNALPPDVKPAFKAKGEEVATTIRDWMANAKLAAKNVLKLIRGWLGMIPNVNKHYLEQESKIKTDHIMELAQHQETLL